MSELTRRKLPPWLIEMPRQTNLFNETVCPICNSRKVLLKSIFFKEGTAFICEKCYENRTLADIYQPPSFKEFVRRVRRKKKSKGTSL